MHMRVVVVKAGSGAGPTAACAWWGQRLGHCACCLHPLLEGCAARESRWEEGW